MKASALNKHYPSLTPDERFRLAIAALARKDHDVLALLRTTCPTKTYTAMNEDFQRQWEQSARVVRGFAHGWLTALLWLREAEVHRVRVRTALDYFCEGYVMGANAAWAEAGEAGAYLDTADFAQYSTQPKREVDTPDEWEQAYIGRCSELKTMWEGFARFCAAVSFAPEALLGWWTGAGEYIERGRAILDSDLPVDDDVANEMCRMYLWLWNQQEMVMGEVEL